MSYFSGESRLAVGELAVYYHTHSEAPGDIEEEHILLIVSDAADVLAVCHCPGVIFHEYPGPELLLEYLGDRPVLADEIAEAVSRLIVHAAGEIETVGEDLGPVYSRLVHEIFEEGAECPERLFRAFESVSYIFLKINDFTLEVGDGHTYVVQSDFDSYNVAGRRIQPIDAWSSAACGAELSDFLYESVLYQFSDELGDCRYADADLAADLRDAVRPFIYEFAEYGLLYGRTLAFGVVEK